MRAELAAVTAVDSCLLRRVVDMVSPLMVPLIESSILDKWDSISQMSSLTCPLLFLSGRSDRLVSQLDFSSVCIPWS